MPVSFDASQHWHAEKVCFAIIESDMSDTDWHRNASLVMNMNSTNMDVNSILRTGQSGLICACA